MDKIDSKGQYCHFPGTTVVSAIQAADQDFWRRVHDRLKNSPTICKYYSPLPYESYHMTTAALDTKHMAKDKNWKEFIDERTPFYSELHNDLLADPIFPEVQFGLLSEASGITLEVTLSTEQIAAIQKFAQKHGCEESVPHCFHITLAYQYQSFPAEDHLKIIQELRAVSQMLKQKKKIGLEPPKLCYFQDMTCFTPWDGEKNPFPEASTRRSTTHFSATFYKLYSHFEAALPTLSCCPTPRSK